MEKENLGEASILVELKDGKINVFHGTDKTLLFTKESEPETWEHIWEAIRYK